MKIAERMANGAKIWTTHPMQVLHDWAPGPGDVFPRSEFTMQHQILQATLSLYGVNPSTQHGERSRYHFAADNARAWAQTACAMYAMLEKRLFTPFFEAEGRTPRPMPRASMDVESITVVADYLDTFAVLLDLPPLRAIFTHPSFSARLAPRGASASAPPAAGPDAALDDAPRREEESEGEHVFRYLRAVVAWVAAALGVVQHEVFRSGVPVEVYHVVVPRAATLPLAPPVLHAVRDEVLAQLGDDAARGAATKWFEKREKAERRKPYVAKVHAESALLGILVDEETRRAVPELRKVFEFNGKLLNNVQSMFAVSYVPHLPSIRRLRSCLFAARLRVDRQHAQLLRLVLVARAAPEVEVQARLHPHRHARDSATLARAAHRAVGRGYEGARCEVARGPQRRYRARRAAGRRADDCEASPPLPLAFLCVSLNLDYYILVIYPYLLCV